MSVNLDTKKIHNCMYDYFRCRIYGEKGACFESSSVMTATMMEEWVGLGWSWTEIPPLQCYDIAPPS